MSAAARRFDPVVDLHDRPLVHHHVLGERAELAHPVEVLAAQVVAVGAVGDHRAREDGHAEVAEVAATRDAHGALAARRDERRGDEVPRREVLDLGAHRVDDPRPLVAADRREHRPVLRQHREDLGGCGEVAVSQVLVGLAHPRVRHLHPDLVGVRVVDDDLLGPPRLLRALHDRCPDLHRPSHQPRGPEWAVADPTSAPARGSRGARGPARASPPSARTARGGSGASSRRVRAAPGSARRRR